MKSVTFGLKIFYQDFYHEYHFFNAEETGYCFKSLLNKTQICNNKKCHDREFNKETCLLAVNTSDTKKLKTYLIRKSAKPRCLKGINQFPVDSNNNRKTRKAGDIFKK